MERWSHVLNLLKNDIGEQDFRKWIKPTKLVAIEGDDFFIETPNRFIQSWIENNFEFPLRDSIGKIYRNPTVALNFVLPKSQAADSDIKPHMRQKETTTAAASKPNRSGLNTKYTFESFVVGASNQFANAAAQAVADAPGENYNPLFIYGGVGLGKTHLMHAIGSQMRKRSPELKICYLSSERFINELINSLRLKKMADFRQRYRNFCDVLLIDDIQFIAGKERSQEEFFHTFNTLYELKRQIILTSDKAPKEIPGLEERLRSRFEWGLIADIQTPELETRVAILRKKAEDQEIDLPSDVALFLADSIHDNIRELEGALIRLCAYASLMGKEINLGFAQEVFKDLIKPPKEITIADIQRVVAKSFNIKPADLCSSRKFRYIALPRQIAMYLSRKLTNASFPDIGGKFGGKDHTTVLHAVKKVEHRLSEDRSLRNTIESLEKSVRFGP